MPNRFVVTGYSNEKVVFEKIGNAIPNELQVSLDPSDTEVISRDEEGNIIVNPNLKWLFDFDTAEQLGMAMRIQLEELEATVGFDRLIVLGIRSSSDEKESSALLEELFNNHHYSANGFSFVKQGTPTNNTEEQPSGFSSTDFANETSYGVETGDALFTESNLDLEKCDGQRFADALGINPEILYHVNESNLTDVSEAKQMNTALWPGTLGYYMNEMMDPLFSDSQIEFTRNFFTNFVTGRGPLPAIRIGNQPYGILLTSSFSNWSLNKEEVGDEYENFSKMYSILSNFQNTWDELVKKVKTAGESGNSDETLLNVIGLQAGSVEFYERKATDDTFTWKYLNLQNNEFGYSYIDVFSIFRDSILSAIGIDTNQPPKISNISFFNLQNKLTGHLIDENPLSEENSILPYNYIDWLKTSSSNTIFKEEFINGVTRPTALLYFMLRNGFLQQVWLSVHALFLEHKLISSAVKEKSILNVSKKTEMTKSDYMLADVSKLFPSSLTRGRSMSTADFVIQDSVIKQLKDDFMFNIKSALNILCNLPTARLERLLTEHIDLCSYRLDAWQTGLFTKRIEYLRNKNNSDNETEKAKKGIYIGAFGWVEDIRPDTNSLIQVNDFKIKGNKLNNIKDKVYENPKNGGYIHGFSLNHALTGAVLRSAYLSNADKSNTDIMSVNLSSERIRKAMYFIEGIRNGQDLSSLLGYQFERGLHENYPDLELDEFIYSFREKYPLIKSKIKKKATDTKSFVTNNVVDGYALMEASKDLPYPYDVTGMPDKTSKQGKAIISEVEKLVDVIDAISDLALGEGVYQTIQGNNERAGAVLKSYSEGKNPPLPQIVNTPRKGNTLTNRITVIFETEPSDNLWGTTITPRAKTEKGLNKWLGSIIGDPKKIICQVSSSYTKSDGTESFIEQEIKLSDLDIQPIDFVLDTGNTFGNGSSELEKRLSYHFKSTNNIPDSVITKIKSNFRNTKWDESFKTFFEMIPFVKNLRQIITMCRPSHALDYMLPTESQLTTTNNMKGYDLEEIKNNRLTGRLDKIQTDLDKKKEELKTALEGLVDPITSSAIESLRNKLKEIADFGITSAFPVSASGYSSVEYELLKSQTVSILSLLETQLLSSKDLLNHTPLNGNLSSIPTEAEILQDESRKKEELLTYYSRAAKLLLGSSFMLIPKYNLNDPGTISEAISNSNNLIRYSTNDLKKEFVVDEWLQGVSRVRERTANFEEVIMYNQNLNNSYLNLTPIQIPNNSIDHWAAVEFPEDMKINKDIVSIVSHLSSDYKPADVQSGILIDEWTELVPTKIETTGIAFQYDQPNAMPPQSLLLAVTPNITGKWIWNDLMDILNDTLDRAKRRAVEPDLIDETEYAHFLPSIIAAFSQSAVTVSTSFIKNNKINFM